MNVHRLSANLIQFGSKQYTVRESNRHRCDTDLVTAKLVEQDKNDGHDNKAAKQDGSVCQGLPQLGLPVRFTVTLEWRNHPAFQRAAP